MSCRMVLSYLSVAPLLWCSLATSRLPPSSCCPSQLLHLYLVSGEGAPSSLVLSSYVTSPFVSCCPSTRLATPRLTYSELNLFSLVLVLPLSLLVYVGLGVSYLLFSLLRSILASFYNFIFIVIAASISLPRWLMNSYMHEGIAFMF